MPYLLNVLLQLCAALAAAPPVDIATQKGPAGGTAPVAGGKTDERHNGQALEREERSPGMGTEEIRAFVDRRKQQDEKERCGDRDDLAGLSRAEVAACPVLFSHLILFQCVLLFR